MRTNAVNNEKPRRRVLAAGLMAGCVACAFYFAWQFGERPQTSVLPPEENEKAAGSAPTPEQPENLDSSVDALLTNNADLEIKMDGTNVYFVPPDP